MNHEADVLTRVKRETAREAREIRAAKRRDADIGVNRFARRKRIKHSQSHSPPALPSEQTGNHEDEQASSPPTDVDLHRRTLSSSKHEHDTDVVSVNSSDNEVVPMRDGEQTHRPMSTDSKSSKENECSNSSSSSSDSEDELIDIGSPLSPPEELTSPTAHHPQSESPPLSSPPLLASDTSSPRKGFAIYSETVIEQSEQPYADYEQHSPYTSNTATPSHGDLAYHSKSNQYYNSHRSPLLYDSTVNSHGWPADGQHSHSTAAIPHHSRATDSESFSGGSRSSSRSSASSSASDIDVEVGGTTVTWEDNRENVPSEAPSEVAESDRSTDDGENEDGDVPILPLRINKKTVCWLLQMILVSRINKCLVV